MKKLILLASIAISAIVYQPAKAQVSLNINIGARPYYTPVHYYTAPNYVYVEQPRYVQRSHYVPARRVVVARPVHYARPQVYSTKHTSYRVMKHKAPKHYGKHHGRGRH